MMKQRYKIIYIKSIEIVVFFELIFENIYHRYCHKGDKGIVETSKG